MMSSGNRSRLITLLALPVSDPRFAANHPIAVLLVGRTNNHRITTNATEPNFDSLRRVDCELRRQQTIREEAADALDATRSAPVAPDADASLERRSA
jgi:hypothetical protein